MPKFEIECEKRYYRYITIEAPDRETALSMVGDIVTEPDSGCGYGFIDYGNPFYANITNETD